jgi:hypothetical protein
MNGPINDFMMNNDAFFKSIKIVANIVIRYNLN